MGIAGDLCVYTNHTTVMEVLQKEVQDDVNVKDASEGTRLVCKYLGLRVVDKADQKETLVDGDVKLTD